MRLVLSILLVVGAFLSITVMATTPDSQQIEEQTPSEVTDLAVTALPDNKPTVCEASEPKLTAVRLASCWQCRECNPNQIKSCGFDGHCVSAGSAGCWGASYPYACLCE